MRQLTVYSAVALGSLLAVMPSWANGPVTPRFAKPQTTAADLKLFQAEVEKKDDVRCKNDNNFQRVCDSPSEMTIWVFTLPGHPAHPAASRGVMVFSESGGSTSVGIDRSGHYAGDLKAFDAWMEEFKRLDKRQLDAMSR
jgi:hypothetical protein